MFCDRGVNDKAGAGCSNCTDTDTSSMLHLFFASASSRQEAALSRQPGCSTSSPLRLRFRFASPMIRRHRPLIGRTRLGCHSNCSNCTRTRPLCHRLLSVSSRRRQRVIGRHRSLVDRGFESSATDEMVHKMKADEEGERQEGLMDSSGGVVAAKEARNGMNRSRDGLHWPSSADSWRFRRGRSRPGGNTGFERKCLTHCITNGICNAMC